MNQESWYETGLGWAVIGLVIIIIIMGFIIYGDNKTIADCLDNIDTANSNIQQTSDSLDSIQTELADRDWSQMDSDVGSLEAPQQVSPDLCVQSVD